MLYFHSFSTHLFFHEPKPSKLVTPAEWNCSDHGYCSYLGTKYIISGAS